MRRCSHPRRAASPFHPPIHSQISPDSAPPIVDSKWVTVKVRVVVDLVVKPVVIAVVVAVVVVVVVVIVMIVVAEVVVL